VVHFVPQGLHELIARHVATHQDLSGTELHAQVTFANQQLTQFRMQEDFLRGWIPAFGQRRSVA
jgi:hypothetical protein